MNNTRKLLPWREAMKVNWRAIKMLYQYNPQMILSRLLFVAWEAFTPYIGIYLSALIVEELAGSGDAERLIRLVWITLISSAVIVLVRALLTKWRDVYNYSVHLCVEGILAKKMLDMDFVSTDDPRTHELLARISHNATGGGWGLNRVFQYEELIGALLKLCGGITLTVTLFTSRVPDTAGNLSILNHPLMILLVIGMMLFITYIAPVLSNKAGNYSVKYAAQQDVANRHFTHYGYLGGKREFAADVRIYRQYALSEKYCTGKNNFFSSQGVLAKLNRGPVGLLKAASAGVSVLFTGIVYGFVCMKAYAGAFGIGAVTQYAASIVKVSEGVSGLISAAGDMRNNAIFLEVIFEYMDIPNSMYQGSLTVEKRRDREYEVEFKNVSFRYPGSENFVLKHVNMKFKIGSKLAVVGMNGSGKTTFIKLLCRLYDPTEGEILLNGIDIRKYNYLDYMNIFSVVFQDFCLLPLKLGENVGGKIEYDRELVTECLKKAGYGERLANMSEGLETYLYKDYTWEGTDVSGGEAQKIALARTLYKDAPFMILDEPTAALDPIAEAEVYSKFNEIVGDKTAIYISHRLSSCKFCDEIAVFHEGAVVQMGTHSQLLADEKGKYYELWNAQAQYYTA
ncbi:MAG: ABC transporter ATP-binding protein [Lachnospiraceae bacterium]|nr:ABC transporter ATP-binding protein [Lachnospiraceae bacterium]